MNGRSENDATEARLIHALTEVAERTTAEPDWNRVAADAGPVGGKSKGFGPATFAVAAVVMVLVGLGVAFLNSGAEEVNVSADGVVILPGETVLSEDPLIVSAAPAPEPAFDTSGLGQEVVIDPVVELDVGIEELIGRTGTSGLSPGTLVKATVIGRLDGQPWVTAVWDKAATETPVPVEAGQVFRSWSLAGTGGSSVGDPVEQGSLRYLEPPALEDDWDDGVGFTTPEGTVEWGPLPAEVSVVTFADDEDVLWTRPSGGVALIPSSIDPGESFTVEAFDADGELLATITQTAPNSEDAQLDSEEEDTDSTAEEAMEDATEATEDRPVLGGIWEVPETTLVPGSGISGVMLVPMDDRLIVLHTQNSGNDMVGEIYDPATGTATALEPSGAVWRANPAVAWTGENLLIVGGSNEPGIDDQALVHNPELGTWRALPEPPEDLHPADDLIAGPGAWTGTELLLWQDGLALDPETEQWRAIADYPGPRRVDPVMVWTGDRLVVWGGCDAAVVQCDDLGERLLDDGYVYDPSTDTWELMAPSPLAAGEDPLAVAAGDQVLFYSGQVDGAAADGAAVDLVASYDPSLDTWTVLPNPPLEPRRGEAWTERDFTLWGGEGSGTVTADGRALNPDTGSWFELPELPEAAAPGPYVVAWVDGQLYVSSAPGGQSFVYFAE